MAVPVIAYLLVWAEDDILHGGGWLQVPGVGAGHGVLTGRPL